MEFDELFRSRSELAVGALATIIVLVLLRMILGVATGDTIDWGTWVGLASGLLGAVVWVGVLELLVDVGDDELVLFHQIQYAHVVYGTVAGALYPPIIAVLGLDRGLWSAFPQAFVGGLAYSVLVFVVAMGIYILVGAIRIDEDGVREVAVLAGLYLLYGVVFGVSMSLTPKWYQLFSI